MDNHLQPQLKNPHELKNVLREVPVSYKLSDGRVIKTLLVYLPTKDGVSYHSTLFEKIKEGILYNFVFSCAEIQKKLGVDDNKSAEKLFEKAIRKISQHTAKGELGELLLFTLLDVYFKAPKILSKISLKTSRRMPVFGADAVHAQFHDGKLMLYLGESKLHADFKSAATKATNSIKSAKEKYVDEFDLLDSYIDFPNINPKLEAELLELLDPFSSNDIASIIHSPCFIGFTEPGIISGAESEDEFLKKYKELARGYISDFFDKIEKQGVDINETTLLMLPFSCVDVLASEFIDYIGIEK